MKDDWKERFAALPTLTQNVHNHVGEGTPRHYYKRFVLIDESFIAAEIDRARQEGSEEMLRKVTVVVPKEKGKTGVIKVFWSNNQRAKMGAHTDIDIGFNTCRQAILTALASLSTQETNDK